MTAKPSPRPRTAAQAARAFYADPAMRLAAEAARNGEDWTQVLRTRPPVATQPPGTRRPVASRQVRDAVAGRPVKALPTRRMRSVKRRVRRTERRLVGAFAVLGIVLLTLAFLIPPVAAVTVAAVSAGMYLAHSK